MKRPVQATVLVVLMFVFGVGQADGELVFFCNYDVVLTAEDSVGQINSRARVRNGHAIPIEFQNHRIDILVASAGEGGATFAITLFEKSGEYWYPINPEPLTFGGNLGVPVRYQWSGGDLSLDVAISVSDQRRLE